MMLDSLSGYILRRSAAKSSYGVAIFDTPSACGGVRHLLSNAALKKHGYFDHQVVASWIKQHLDGRANHSHRLWALMVFEMWNHNERVRA